MFIRTLLKSIFGSRNERVIRQLKKTVDTINSLEASIAQLSDDELKSKTTEFKQLLIQGTSVDTLLPEAFAVVREASKRTLGLRHFDVQLIGGMVLHHGKIAEMRTGEGKTLVATLPAYLNALSGKGVHIVTVNDYLAKRDAEWMRPVYEFLGLTVGINLTTSSPEEKKAAYAADITYGTNNEFGFDYLRDNMAFSLEDKVQKAVHFAIVDEVDSILIDESRTPLIISGPSSESSEVYQKINALIPELKKRETEDGEGDFYLDEKQKQAYLTEAGHEHVEQLFEKAKLIEPTESLYDAHNITLMHHLNACLRAHHLYQKDVEYIVSNGEIIIIDEHTGRSMPGRRWSDGLHQAIEAKEHVSIQNENQTLASITFQNYFRLYDKLSGMTGTADTEAYEFQEIYHLEVIVIPTNRSINRKDLADKIYLTHDGKFNAIMEDILDCHKRQQPVLVGTASIETSEYLSNLLKKNNIPHQVLNAKFHEKEAHIIAQAGKPGAVTIATNMAGRGTDIVLGGNIEAIIQSSEANEEEAKTLREKWTTDNKIVLENGGLHIIGSERHESRRIDNQLRGRSGRQGDPGSTRFYLSLEDHLMRIFASPRLAGFMQKLGMKQNDAIEHPWITKAIENAQRKVESFHFDIRKQLLDYDDVANEQRKVIYEQRNHLLAETNLRDMIETICSDVAEQLVNTFIPPDSMEEQWDVPALETQIKNDFDLTIDIQKRVNEKPNLPQEDITTYIKSCFFDRLKQHEDALSDELMRQLEQSIVLQSLDTYWKEHLAAMDHLRQGIHLRGYAQKDPKQEYKKEAFNLFSEMLETVKYDVAQNLMRIHVNPEDIESLEEQRRQQSLATQSNMQLTHLNFNVANPDEEEQTPEDLKPKPIQKTHIGRNQPCPCGSGKKYKHCHGKL